MDKTDDDAAKQTVGPTKPMATKSTPETNTLPDIVLRKDKSDMVTGLLMLGDTIENIDKEVDNEELLPVDKPKQPDITKEIDETYQNKKNSQQNIF